MLILVLNLLFVIGITAQTIVFTNVNVIPMDKEQVLQNQMVLVRNGIIVEIGKNVKVPKDALRIDGEGKFLIPGLWDMHVHLTLATELAFPVLLANGVTGVRDLGGEFKKIDEWRKQINDGRLLGPNILRAGLYVDGPKDAPDRLIIKNEAEARQAVITLKKQKVDFIKIHNAVPRNAFFALLAEAKKQKLKVVGHIPLEITPFEATNSGQNDFEHMTSLIEGAVVSASKNGKSALQTITEFNDEAATNLFRKMVKNNTWMTPNLIAEQAITFRVEIEANPDKRSKYVASQLKKYWLENFIGKPTAARKLLLQRYLDLVKIMRKENVRILAGTDLGLRDIYPGFSLHDELELLVKAGLTPFESLQTATANPAEFLDLRRLFGTLEKGKRADMVLLDANPLENINNIRKINGVLVKRQYLILLC